MHSNTSVVNGPGRTLTLNPKTLNTLKSGMGRLRAASSRCYCQGVPATGISNKIVKVEAELRVLKFMLLLTCFLFVNPGPSEKS